MFLIVSIFLNTKHFNTCVTKQKEDDQEKLQVFKSAVFSLTYNDNIAYCKTMSMGV